MKVFFWFILSLREAICGLAVAIHRKTGYADEQMLPAWQSTHCVIIFLITYSNNVLLSLHISHRQLKLLYAKAQLLTLWLIFHPLFSSSQTVFRQLSRLRGHNQRSSPPKKIIFSCSLATNLPNANMSSFPTIIQICISFLYFLNVQINTFSMIY